MGKTAPLRPQRRRKIHFEPTESDRAPKIDGHAEPALVEWMSDIGFLVRPGTELARRFAVLLGGL
jgi:hypothetical protein